MKRALLMLLAILVIPGMLMATSQLGVYQQDNEGNLAIRPPAAGVMFTCYLYIVNNDERVVGIQYKLDTPTTIETGIAPEFMLISWAAPDGHTIVDIGNPWTGHSVGYDYPVSCYPHGYAIMLKYTFMAVLDCYTEGGDTLLDFMIDVVGDPTAPPDPIFGSLYGVYAPNMDSFGIDGLTSVVCPGPGTPNKEESWGAIKSMYR